MNKTDVGIIIFKVLIIIIIVVAIAFNVWACANYGDKPINEVPVWVLWFMLRR